MMASSSCYAWPPHSSALRVFCSDSWPNSTSILFSDISLNPSAAVLRPPPQLRPSFHVLFARRRNNSSAVPKTNLSKSKTTPTSDEEEDEIDEDPFEALFSQLEEDLKNDEEFSDGEIDTITEDDFAKLEQELKEALSDEDSDEDFEALPSKSVSTNGSDNDEESQPKLKNWQLRQLARALKIGRRKTSIKNLSAELGLERAYVLNLLRQPPPNLLMMCDSLPNEAAKKPEPVSEPLESSFDSDTNFSKSQPRNDEVPVHVMQARWSMRKRIKKVHLATLELVYAKTKRPTNAMISSIVHVTNLPWKRVVKWFDDKRLEDGVPAKREPFRRAIA